MDSLSFAFGGRGPLFTGGADLPADDDFIPIRNMGFTDPDFPDDSGKKPIFADRFLENSVESSDHCNGDLVSAKRLRATDSKPQSPSCQVRGCNKDLSNSKDYHKRHRVCDVHSKTAVVIVNGIQQRFCQQCSRFHDITEFDEGKRSCRKRLKGHNERRRKPQFNAHLFGSAFGSEFSKASFLFSGFFPSRFLGSEPPMKDTASIKLERNERARGRLSVSSVSSCALSLLSPHQSEKNRESGNCHNLRKPRKRGLEKSSIIVDSFNGEGFPPISNDGVEFSSSNHFTSRESASNTVDLAELSLHLQRIEQQKQFGAQMQMMQDF